MKLLYQTHSPFARKALVFAHEAGIADRIEVIHQETSPTKRNETVFAENPLGKVPVLIRSGLPALFDSDVICAYLDGLHPGRKLIPAEGEARWETVRRPEGLCYAPLRDGYVAKLLCGYDWLERELDVAAPTHVGHIALATSLSWLEFRELPGLRDGRPRLASWLEEFQDRPSMRATPLSGETHD